ncbi:MAG: T9SS type A sorting domain-containing protein [Bacteroidetes bacterium]|nr:T9SS type A sorting domain-containing protein [Bacteroidota bacterium]
MKKLLLFITALMSAGAIMAQTDCSDIFMSEYVEGWNNNKGLELYNPTKASITLDGVYRLIRFSNGSTTSDTEIAYTLPLTGTIDSYKVMVIIQDTVPAGQDTMVWPGLRKKGTWLAPYAYASQPPYTQGGNVVFWNGDDAVSLQKKQINGTWKDIDIFGEIGVRPTNWQGNYSPSGAWTDVKPYILGVGIYLTKSKTLYRKHQIKHGVDRATMIHYGDSATGGIPNSFNAWLEYDTLPANFFDSLGTHWCDCKQTSGINQIKKNYEISILPNPVTNRQFTVKALAPVASVEIVSVVGDLVLQRQFSDKQKEITVLLNALAKGVYLVRITFEDKQTVTRKIIIE